MRKSCLGLRVILGACCFLSARAAAVPGWPPGRADNTKKIQAAIGDCSVKGGGIVVISSGTFISGSLFFNAKTALRVEKGAVLKATTDPTGFPLRTMRVTGFNIPWRTAFINANGVDDSELPLEGTIDGSGMQRWQSYWTAAEGIPKDYYLGMPGAKKPEKSGVKHTPPPDPQLKVPRPTLVNIKDARRILVRDVLLNDAGGTYSSTAATAPSCAICACGLRASRSRPPVPTAWISTAHATS